MAILLNLVKKYGKYAVLRVCCLHVRFQIFMQLLLRMRPDCDVNFRGERGRCLVHLVVGDPENMRIVLQYRPQLDIFDENGASPLLLAIAHRQPESVRLLTEAGCDVMLVGLMYF